MATRIPDPAPVRAFLDERHLEFAQAIAEFSLAKIPPLGEPDDDRAARLQARDLLSLLGGGGWFRPILEQDLRACCLAREALAGASPLADAVFALQALGSLPIIRAG